MVTWLHGYRLRRVSGYRSVVVSEFRSFAPPRGMPRGYAPSPLRPFAVSLIFCLKTAFQLLCFRDTGLG